ncbi:MAG: hypothetical protein JWR38_5499 [Mucilaginibacter sp.]|nr:hypothetical protein [Mucilaginibacter sp.]
MIFLSQLLYLISHHGFLFIVFLMIVSILLAVKFGKIAIPIVAFVLSIISAFTSQYLNAAFLNAYGTRTTAVITKATETNSTLNDAPIFDYDFIVKKLNGSYAQGTFSTTTAAIYPIANSINIPQEGLEFPVKFIPGYEKNIVILYDESEDGKRAKLTEALGDLNKARIQYEASPDDHSFTQEYIDALEKFIRENKDQDMTDYESKLAELKKAL